MAWSTPEVREVCVGMEVTSYLSPAPKQAATLLIFFAGAA
jgi:coenzyme PQQ precursor peptide PqqA